MLKWYVCFALSALIMLSALVWVTAVCIRRYKRKRLFTPNNVLFVGTFVSSAILFFPMYLHTFAEDTLWVGAFKSVMLAVQHAICLFAIDGGFIEIILGNVEHLEGVFYMAYTAYSAFFYIFAPILTFGFILSFFKNVSAYRRYVCSFWKNTHVFSELNEHTLALAKSIAEKADKTVFGKDVLIVFTDVIEKNEEENCDFIEEAKELGAVLFSKDLSSVKYRLKRSFRKLNFYLISEDESEKIRHATDIMRSYDLKDVSLYVFSDDIRCEMLLGVKNVENMSVIRINDIQSLIYHNLDEHGLRLFDNAVRTENGEKQISAVIVGLGKYGVEMLKALTWFCQADGYSLKITAFDEDAQAEERINQLCPGLESRNHKGYIEDARYDIDIYSGIDVKSADFIKKLSQIGDITYVFICLGTDEMNIDTSVRIRRELEKLRAFGKISTTPDVETVVYTDIADAFGFKWGIPEDEPNGIVNFKGQKYKIHIIGDLDSFYTVDTVISNEYTVLAEGENAAYAEKVYSSAMEEADALEREGRAEDAKKAREDAEKKRKSDISAFRRFEYNYRSSIARVIHDRLKDKLYPKPEGDSEALEARKLQMAKIEHRRWNAYMITDGYEYSGSTDSNTRNDLAKLHHNLHTTSQLSKADFKKDFGSK